MRDTFQIEVDVIRLPERSIQMKMHVGDGHVGDIPVEYTLGMGSGDPIFHIGDRWYQMSIESLLVKLVERIEEESGEI